MEDKLVERASFLVRIWREKGESAWHGWVQHTQSMESTYICSLEELQGFFERWAGHLGDPTRKGLK